MTGSQNNVLWWCDISTARLFSVLMLKQITLAKFVIYRHKHYESYDACHDIAMKHVTWHKAYTHSSCFKYMSTALLGYYKLSTCLPMGIEIVPP